MAWWLLFYNGGRGGVWGVGGLAPRGEAMGRVFDALQVERVARGLAFACVLQAVKALAQ